MACFLRCHDVLSCLCVQDPLVKFNLQRDPHMNIPGTGNYTTRHKEDAGKDADFGVRIPALSRYGSVAGPLPIAAQRFGIL